MTKSNWVWLSYSCPRNTFRLAASEMEVRLSISTAQTIWTMTNSLTSSNIMPVQVARQQTSTFSPSSLALTKVWIKNTCVISILKSYQLRQVPRFTWMRILQHPRNFVFVQPANDLESRSKTCITNSDFLSITLTKMRKTPRISFVSYHRGTITCRGKSGTRRTKHSS